MFSKELEALIEASLADGILEDNEKAALVKRAQAEGVDLGELEIYINSIMQKRMQTKTAEEESRDAAHRREQQGNVCPHCGTEIPPMTKICPNCGRAISGYETEGDKEMQSLIDQLEKFLVEVKAGDEKEYARNKATLESLMRKAETLYGQDHKIKKILFDLKEEVTKVEKKLNAKKRIFGGIIAAVSVLLIIIGYSVYSSYQQTHDPQVIHENVVKCIEKGDLVQARNIIKNNEIGTSYLHPALEAIADAYVKNEDYSSAVSFIKDYSLSLSDYQKRLIQKLLEKREYDNAILLQDNFLGLGKKGDFEIFLNKMIENGDQDRAKAFVIEYAREVFYQTTETVKDKKVNEYLKQIEKK